MKKLLFVAVVVVAMMAMAVSSAFATGWAVDTGWSADDAAHGGYASTTNACKACHDVHGATAPTAFTTPSGNAKLYRWADSGTGCNYCHYTSASASSVQVYTLASTEASHGIGATNVPDATDNSGIAGNTINALDCFDCHNAAPHGAGSTANLIAGDMTDVAVATAYCAGCHDYNITANSHSIAVQDGTYAFGDADSCMKCHTTPAPTFPHESGLQYAFLGGDGFAPDALDAKCITCHISAPSGVGLTY